jgi:formylmethanofuran dehydrogenase subunit B
MATVVCAGCGCLCDDIHRDGTNLCEKGQAYWEGEAPAEPRTLQNDAAIAQAISLLKDATAPGLFGLNQITTEAASAAVALATKLDAWLSPWPADPLRFWGHTAPDLALTRAEMQEHADLVIYLGFSDGVDAAQPRHRERHLARGLGLNRKQLHLNWQGSEGLDQTIALRLHLDRGDSTSDTVMSIASAIREAKCVQVYVLARLAQQTPSIVTHWQALATQERKQRRMGVALLGNTGRARTVTETLTWLTGYPGPMKFTNGIPHFLPHLGEVEALLRKQTSDIVLWIGQGYQPEALARERQARLSVHRVQSGILGPALVQWQLPGLHPTLDAHIIRGDTVMLRLCGNNPGIPDPLATLLTLMTEKL